jgi:hypothetical protein
MPYGVLFWFQGLALSPSTRPCDGGSDHVDIHLSHKPVNFLSSDPRKIQASSTTPRNGMRHLIWAAAIVTAAAVVARARSSPIGAIRTVTGHDDAWRLADEHHPTVYLLPYTYNPPYVAIEACLLRQIPSVCFHDTPSAGHGITDCPFLSDGCECITWILDRIDVHTTRNGTTPVVLFSQGECATIELSHSVNMTLVFTLGVAYPYPTVSILQRLLSNATTDRLHALCDAVRTRHTMGPLLSCTMHWNIDAVLVPYSIARVFQPT